MTRKMHSLRCLTALLIVLCMTFLCSFSTFAAGELTPGSVSDIRAENYPTVPLLRDGVRFDVDARLIEETTYVPLRNFCDTVTDCTVSWNAKTRTASVTAEGLTLTAADRSHYLVANGRYLYTWNPIIVLSNGTMYVPVRILAKALGVDITWDVDTRSVTVSGSYDPILSGDKYYNADSVYWLSRIISSESQGEPLLGQIAVGNVVLNRVKSPDYPNTIYGVIFDRKYGVQFSPVLYGTIYNTPYYLSVIAAKICLEGTTVDTRILYFFDPTQSTSFWISENCKFAFRIQNHHFYY